MMGKGKTSVITPLLAFSIIFINKKTPIIITTTTLIEQTKKYLGIFEFLTGINIDVISDTDAKKRWITRTDLNLFESLKTKSKK
jgi:hypothetical protein